MLKNNQMPSVADPGVVKTAEGGGEGVAIKGSLPYHHHCQWPLLLAVNALKTHREMKDPADLPLFIPTVIFILKEWQKERKNITL